MRQAVENWLGDLVMLPEGEPRGIGNWGLLVLSCKLAMLPNFVCSSLGKQEPGVLTAVMNKLIITRDKLVSSTVP